LSDLRVYTISRARLRAVERDREHRAETLFVVGRYSGKTTGARPLAFERAQKGEEINWPELFCYLRYKMLVLYGRVSPGLYALQTKEKEKR